MEPQHLNEAYKALQLYPGYAEEDLKIFQEFQHPDVRPESGFVKDFLGSRTRTTSLWKEGRALDGHVYGLPVPGDYHAETIEWLGLLKAVRSARDQYVAMELGAGFGPWTIAGAVAARSHGIKDIRLCAVEADPDHVRYLHQHFLDNGFNPDDHSLLQGAVAARAGLAHWPVLKDVTANEVWACRPMEAREDYTGRQFESVLDVHMIPMRELVLMEPVWDLVHIDVQGDELVICSSCVDELTARARWLIIGTHSRKLDGDLIDLLGRSGWILEHEKPAKFTFTPNYKTLEAMTTLDGTQVWRNPQIPIAGS